MYICGWYEVVETTDQVTNKVGPGFGDTHAEYVPSLSSLVARMSNIAKEHCDAALPSIEDEDARTEHINRWASHATTMRMNPSNHQQIAGPDGRIYWWLKLV